MSDVKEMRIFSAEQIIVPDEFPGILKNFTKEVIRSNPQNIIGFGRQYFEDLLRARGYFEQQAHQRDKVGVQAKEFYLSHQGQFKADYVLEDTIHEGGISSVRVCKNIMTGVQRAVKIVRKEDLEFGERAKLLEELDILKEMDHPNICRVVEMYEDPKRLYFVNELLSGGELFEAITVMGSFSEQDAAAIIRQILSATSYIHKKKIVHRDIKPENLIFESQDSNVIKLLDFATSKRIDHEKPITGSTGTAYYVAPEVLTGSYNEKCDIWSIGVILYILLSGSPPFDGANDGLILEKIKIGKFTLDSTVWQNISAEAKDLISKMLTKDPAQRVSADEAMAHPWFQQVLVREQMDLKSVAKALTNLQKFNSSNKMKQAALGFMVQHLLNQKELSELEQIFQQLDKNGNGSLSKDELLEGYQQIYGQNFNEEEVEALIEMADTNGTGEINYSEWLMTAVSREKLVSQNKLESVFLMLDKDHSKTISIDELKNALGIARDVDQKIFADAISDVDSEGKGEITFKEFKTLMRKLFD